MRLRSVVWEARVFHWHPAATVSWTVPMERMNVHVLVQTTCAPTSLNQKFVMVSLIVGIILMKISVVCIVIKILNLICILFSFTKRLKIFIMAHSILHIFIIFTDIISWRNFFVVEHDYFIVKWEHGTSDSS